MEGYKVVNINDLEVKGDMYCWGSDVKKYLFQNKCNWHTKCKCNILSYYENQGAFASSGKPFLDAFLFAYNNHCDVILSPDDVWLKITIEFSKYVNKNSEKMRNLFVDHEGKKELSVTTGAETDESDWNEFFTLMETKIQENTKSEIKDILVNNFSTTSNIERLLSTSVIMNTFKNYFSYMRIIPCCGIRNILFKGELSDWELLYSKLCKLEEFSVDDFWTNYITELKPTILQFIKTYKNNVDVDFWNKIMDIENGTYGSGSTTYFSGWILKFYGIYKQIESDEIKDELIDVPVKIINKLTGITKNVNIVGGLTGISKFEINNYIAYKPQMALIVYHDGNTQTN